MFNSTSSIENSNKVLKKIPSEEEAETKFKDILEAMPDALVIINEVGKIVLVNLQTEKIFNYRRGELIGALIEKLIPERYREKHQGHRTGYLLEPRVRSMAMASVSVEFYGLRKDGNEFPVEISLSPLKDDRRLWILVAIRDVTERNNQTALYNQRQSNFIAHLCHELRNPLHGIQCSLESLQEHLNIEYSALKKLSSIN